MNDDHVARRFELICQLEAARSSKVVTYFLSDRTGASAQIGGDAVRAMYEHLLAIGRTSRIDLFLYSTGGDTDVPWRIVSMIREFADEFAVLVPYKAMSAATMIALGADEIIMGPKGELGPIDPGFNRARHRDDGSTVQERIDVEDIMSYVRFIREHVGLADQTALAQEIAVLTESLDPAMLGKVYRAHSHIRSVAQKLLTVRGPKHSPPDSSTLEVIVETLAERTFQHGHAIGRKEAKELGLNVVSAPSDIEQLLWQLLESYEDLCQTRNPLDFMQLEQDNSGQVNEALTMAAIESTQLAHHFNGRLAGTVKRQTTPQLNLNLNVQLPPGIEPDNLEQASAEVLNQLVQNLQGAVAELVLQEVHKQMPVIGFEGRTQGMDWRGIADWPENN